MAEILFLHDTELSLLRGAELTINQLISLGQTKGFSVSCDLLRDFDAVQPKILSADLVVVNSTSRCRFEGALLRFLLDNHVRYIKVEYDYNFCVRRNILCTLDPQYRLCCNTEKFHLYRELFSRAAFNVFQSPKHCESHVGFYGDAVKHHIIMPPTVDVDALQISTEKDPDVVPFFGALSYLKGGRAYLEFAIQNPKLRFEVYGSNELSDPIPSNVIFKEAVSNFEVLNILGRTKLFFCQPVWPEPSGRLAAEAFLSGCEIISNENIGTFSFDFYPDRPDEAMRQIRETPHKFWSEVVRHLTPDQAMTPDMGRVLAYKSYGGLGDIFFCLPSLYALKTVATEVTFAVETRLVNFFSTHLQGIRVVDEKLARTSEDQFDRVVELGNYPAFHGYERSQSVRYATHKRVKQHAIGHYIDAVARLHIGIDAHYNGYSYFQRKVNFSNPYYTLHAGAGFLPKIWSTENYANLIRDIRRRYPTLGCKVILGPDDPNPLQYGTGLDHVELVTGGIEEVGNAMAGALFHIGNDAGITHVAGAYNVPTVGIYGPTGPGAWGCFSESSEIVWGKPGQCDLKCHYDIIINCNNRVCLSSITVPRVMGALYKLLQNAYPDLAAQPVIHPDLVAEFTQSDCLLKIGADEFLVDFTNAAAREYVVRLLGGDFTNSGSGDMSAFVSLMKEHHIILSIPDFEKVVLP